MFRTQEPAAFTDTTISGATSGVNYYGFLGASWEVAVNAIKNDSRVSMLSRPRIQTTHARSASLFIGERRPVHGYQALGSLLQQLNTSFSF